jgi:hypothetical protein
MFTGARITKNRTKSGDVRRRNVVEICESGVKILKYHNHEAFSKDEIVVLMTNTGFFKNFNN